MTTVRNTVAHYTLEAPLGSSGLATVYHATDTRTGQPVALKLLHSYFLEEKTLIQRYFDELERIRGNPHPNILPPLEWGQDEETIWVATEYIPEGGLRNTWRTPGSLLQGLQIVRGVAAALEHTLALELTHRDLKPNNIFWDRQRGTVRLGDFGMATLGESAHPLVRTALTTPAPAYMAPEYIADGHSDARTEAFSLAVLAYWLLAGDVPYPAEAPSTMYVKAMRYEVVPLTTINPAVPPEIGRIIVRALAPFPHVRPQGPRAFADALAAAAPPEDEQAQIAMSGHTPATAAVAAPLETLSRAPWDADPGMLERLWRVPVPLNLLRSRLVHATLIASLLAAFVLGNAALNSPRPIPPPSTTISADVAPTHWALPRFDQGNTGYVPITSSGIRGKVKWEFQTTAKFLAAPTSDGATVYAATGDSRVVALSAETGEKRWEFTTTGPVDASPVAAGGFVYVGLRDKRVIALDRTTGKLRWQFITENPIISPGVVADGVLYQGSGDGKLYALDAATGALLWSFATGSWIVTPPAVLDDIVVIPSRDGWIHIIERATGRPRFIFHTAGTIFSAPAVSNDHLYVPTQNRDIWAVDVRQRSTFMDRQIYWAWVQLWIFQMAPQPDPPKGFLWRARLPGRAASSAAVANGIVYVGSDSGKLLALDAANGKLQWEFATGSPVLGSPVVTQDTLYAGDDSGKLYALDPRTGKELWRFQAGGSIRTDAVVVGDKLLVAADDGILYALQ